MSKGKAPPIVLSPYIRQKLEEERLLLEEYLNERAAVHSTYTRKKIKTPQYEEADVFPLLRLKAILLAADGYKNSQISDQLQISQHTIGKWRKDFAYILSRADLPVERVTEFFWHTEKPVAGVLRALRRGG